MLVVSVAVAVTWAGGPILFVCAAPADGQASASSPSTSVSVIVRYGWHSALTIDVRILRVNGAPPAESARRVFRASPLAQSVPTSLSWPQRVVPAWLGTDRGAGAAAVRAVANCDTHPGDLGRSAGNPGKSGRVADCNASCVLQQPRQDQPPTALGQHAQAKTGGVSTCRPVSRRVATCVSATAAERSAASPGVANCDTDQGAGRRLAGSCDLQHSARRARSSRPLRCVSEQRERAEQRPWLGSRPLRQPQQDLHHRRAEHSESGDHDREQRREHPTDDRYVAGHSLILGEAGGSVNRTARPAPRGRAAAAAPAPTAGRRVGSQPR